MYTYGEFSIRFDSFAGKTHKLNFNFYKIRSGKQTKLYL